MGIELLSVHRLTLHQILLMAPADARWNSPATLQMVADTCRQRKVKNYEPHVESMTNWLNSPSALWLFAYMKEAFEVDRYGPSMWHGDSGCVVYSPGGQRSKSMLEVIKKDLGIQYPIVDCIESGTGISRFLENLSSYMQRGLMSDIPYVGLSVGGDAIPSDKCSFYCDMAQFEYEMERMSVGQEMSGRIWQRPRPDRSSPSVLRINRRAIPNTLRSVRVAHDVPTIPEEPSDDEAQQEAPSSSSTTVDI